MDLENVFYDILERKNAFLGYKNNKFKKSKNWHFLKEVNPWIFSKNGLFLEVFFLANLGQQNVLCDIFQQNVLCDIFPSFFGFSPKMAIFPIFFFRQYRPRKCLLWHSGTKIAFLGYKHKKFKKSKIWNFFIFSPKMAIFPSFFLGNIGHENVFYDILERKIDFLGYKDKKFKKSKNWHFPHGVNQRFWSKNAHFSNFIFLGNIGLKNVFYNILERKKSLSRL